MPHPGIPTTSEYEGRGATQTQRISVVTTVRDGAKTLARAIASVRAQNMSDLEYIVVDGGSRDSTLDIIRNNADVVTFWKSEPDRGISDGFNKGIALANGEYVMLLNADDWLSPGQIAFGLESLEKTGADFVFGDLFYHDTEGKVLHLVRGDADYARVLHHTMPALNHPTVIMRRSAYVRQGLFDLRWRFAMDYELLLRFHRAGLRGSYDPRMAGHMTLEGVSDRHAGAALREVRDIAISHGHPATASHLLYFYRLLKTKVRRILEAALPSRANLALRHLFNRSLIGVK